MATPTKQISAKTEKAKDGSTEKRVYNKDTRPGSVIFAERADEELRLMNRRFGRLRGLAAAYKAKPTAEQLNKMEAWLNDNIQIVMTELRASLNKPEDVTKASAKDSGFKLLQ